MTIKGLIKYKMDIHEFLQSAGGVLYTFGTKAAEVIGNIFNSLTGWIYSKLSSVTLPMMPTVMKIFSNATLNRTVFYTIVLYIVIMNIVSFLMFGIDKKRAKKRQKRISEKKIMRVCFWGGALGGIIGMSIFKHKTKQKKFSVSIPVLFMIQLILYSFLLGFLGFWAFF